MTSLSTLKPIINRINNYWRPIWFQIPLIRVKAKIEATSLTLIYLILTRQKINIMRKMACNLYIYRHKVTQNSRKIISANPFRRLSPRLLIQMDNLLTQSLDENLIRSYKVKAKNNVWNKKDSQRKLQTILSKKVPTVSFKMAIRAILI